MKFLRLMAMAVLAGTVVGPVCAAPAKSDPAYPLVGTRRTMTTQFLYSALVPKLPKGAHAVDLWIPLPSDSEWQTVSNIVVQAPSHYVITTEPIYKNRMVYVHVDHPKLPVAVGVAFTVDRSEPRVLDPVPGVKLSEAKDDFPAKLTPDRLVPVGARFHRIASKIAPAGEPPVDKERSFFDSIIRSMHYDYRKESPRYAQGDAAFVCNFKKGNCSDLHSYMVALSRSAGIPAVIEFGFPVAGIPMSDPISADGVITGYHCWMWFEDDEGASKRWVPVDVADARRWHDVYRSDVKNYLFGDLLLPRSAVAMSRGRDIVLNPPQKAKPLNYFIYPYAEAGGKSIRVGWKMQYHIVRVGIGRSGAAK